MLETAIEAHEESAELAFWFMMVAGTVSAVALVLLQIQHKTARAVGLLAVVLCIGSSALMARTGYLGGQIRHTEISSNATATQTDAAGVSGQEEEED